MNKIKNKSVHQWGYQKERNGTNDLVEKLINNNFATVEVSGNIEESEIIVSDSVSKFANTPILLSEMNIQSKVLKYRILF